MIGKRSLLNLGMLILAGGLAALVMLEPGRAPEPAPPKVTDLEPASITRIRIDAPGLDGISIERVADNWHMTQPYSVPANTFKVESLLKAASATSHARMPVPAARQDEFDLEPPKASLWLDDTELAFGGTESIDRRRYVRVGDEIHLTDDRYYHHLRSTPEGFVSLKLLPGDAPTHAIHAPDWRLERAEDGKWALIPEQPGVTTDSLRERVDAWRATQAIQVSKLGASESSDTRIEITRESGPEPLVFELLDEPGALLLARPDLGLKYRLSESSRARLLDPPAAPPEAASTSMDPATPS